MSKRTLMEGGDILDVLKIVTVRHGILFALMATANTCKILKASLTRFFLCLKTTLELQK